MCPNAAAPPCVGDGGDHGLLSADPAVNPGWADATAVFVAYCDGGSFAGALEAPLIVEGVPVFLRGRAVLAALAGVTVLTAVGLTKLNLTDEGLTSATKSLWVKQTDPDHFKLSAEDRVPIRVRRGIA